MLLMLFQNDPGGVDDISLYTQSGTNHNEIIDGIAGLVTNNPNIRVKVTRDVVGNWELFLDTNGVFFTQGITFDNIITTSDYFGVFCKYTITRSKKFWFDDFSVTATGTGIEELAKDKTLNKITNILGEPTKPKPNTPLFYIYDDGTVEKRITIE